ncbi:MAG: HAMP domain-containing protein, partial [Nitrospirae bacterium]
MLIKRKFDIFTAGLIVIFIVVFCLTIFANMYLQKKNEELANISKELDFLTGLRVSLHNLEGLLDEYMRNPGRQEATEAEDAFDEFYRLVGKTRSFNMDEDELEMIGYLRSNMQRFSTWITNILSPNFEGSRTAFYQSIKLELFKEVKERIERHWNEDMEKIEAAKLRAGVAEQRVVMVYFITLILLGVVIYLVRRTVRRQILLPLMNLNTSSRRMAEGDLENPIEINSSDELSQLAENFNRMAYTIKQKIEGLEEAYQREQRVVRELAILNEFMGDISNDTEMTDMLRRFAERASDLLKADGAAVVVRDLEGEEFFVSTHE